MISLSFFSSFFWWLFTMLFNILFAFSSFAHFFVCFSHQVYSHLEWHLPYMNVYLFSIITFWFIILYLIIWEKIIDFYLYKIIDILIERAFIFLNVFTLWVDSVSSLLHLNNAFLICGRILSLHNHVCNLLLFVLDSKITLPYMRIFTTLFVREEHWPFLAWPGFFGYQKPASLAPSTILFSWTWSRILLKKVSFLMCIQFTFYTDIHKKLF